MDDVDEEREDSDSEDSDDEDFSVVEGPRIDGEVTMARRPGTFQISHFLCRVIHPHVWSHSPTVSTHA